ncbi:MAG: M48 family metallopeptidase, partial [Opitutales bacterium]
MNVAIQVFLSCLLIKLITELALSRFNRASVENSRKNPPEVARAILDDQTFEKSVDYNLTKSRFGSAEDVFEACLLALLVCWALPWLHNLMGPAFSEGPWGQGFVVIIILLLLQLPGLPFEWHNQFRIEERFGFNKSTSGLWLSDKLKGSVVGFIIGYPLISLLLWFAQSLADTWWIWGFVAFFGFQLLLMVLWPMLILPLFNKLEPLPEGELRDRLMALSGRAGFHAKTIQVIDGSKRSAHSNAFFTGFGKFRRIVLFDTLIEQLEPDELEAVLAHEIGHY